jgi:hypothetical protein
MLRERIAFAKAGMEGKGGLHQPPIDADVDIDAPMKVVIVEPQFAGQTVSEISSRQAEIINQAAGTHRNGESGLDFVVSNSNVRHAVNTAVHNKIDPQAALEIVAQLPRIINAARRAETHADQKGESNLKQIYRYFAGAQIGNDLYTVMLTIKEKTGQPKPEISIYRVYDANTVQKRAWRPLDSPPPEGSESYATPSSSEISLRHLLKGVKDHKGNPYFEQPALTEGGLNETARKEVKRKFDDSPAAEVTGSEIFAPAEPINISEAREKALNWARENGLFRDNYENADTGWQDIAVSEKGIEDSLRHGGGPEKIQTIAALPAFIRDGIFLETTPAHNTKQIGMKSHIFGAKVDIAGKPMAVGFIIKEDMNGRRFYDHELTEMKSLDEVVTHSGAAPASAEGRRSDPHQGLVMSIVKKHLGVKPELTFEQPAYQAQAQAGGSRGRLETISDQSFRAVFTEAAGAKRDGGRR